MTDPNMGGLYRYISTVRNCRGELTHFVGSAHDMDEAWAAAEHNAAKFLPGWGVPFAHGKPCSVYRVVMDPNPWFLDGEHQSGAPRNFTGGRAWVL